jgi:ATP-dependent DNA helicase RecG
MASAPHPAMGQGREVSFDDKKVRSIISDLLVRAVDEVESEELEIKGWCSDERELADKVAEACACIANTSGGFVVVGVAEGVRPGRKFSPCPHPDITPNWLQTKVQNLTRPPVETFPFDASGIAAEITCCPGVNLFALRVPRTRCISGHLTHKGVSKVRVGKQCQPQYYAGDDRTSAAVPQMALDELSSGSIDWAMSQHRKHFNVAATWAERKEFLEQARLLRDSLPDEEYLSAQQCSLASLLLFGKHSSITRNVPFFETVVTVGSEIIRIRKNVIESVRDLCFGESSILQSRVPQIPRDVLKELVVNAFIHRCYRTSGPVLIEISESGFEIRSPGELLTGLSVKTLIHGVPVYRNLLLADGARFAGLCDKIGRGVDLIFEEVISSGLGFPEFESGNNFFTARIPLAGSAEFKEFVRKRSQALSQLDEVIVLRTLWSRPCATIDDLCANMQRKSEFAERLLGEMCRKNMVEQVRGGYQLTPGVRRDIETIFQSDQLSLDSSLWT